MGRACVNWIFRAREGEKELQKLWALASFLFSRVSSSSNLLPSPRRTPPAQSDPC